MSPPASTPLPSSQVNSHPQFSIMVLNTKALSLLLFIGTLLASHSVQAHGGMTTPTPRALATMGLDISSTFGFPIKDRADYTNGKGGDCLGFTADTDLQTLAYGDTTLTLRANNGANHIGPCTAYLVDPSDSSNKLQVGYLDNCMRSLHPAAATPSEGTIPAEMTVTVPTDATLPCQDGHCVLEFYWVAQHITPYEYYNSCADVKISGSSDASASSSSPTTAPAATTATPVVTTATPATTTATPVSTTATPKTTTATSSASSEEASPSTSSSSSSTGKYVYVGDAEDTTAMTQWCNWNCPQFCPTNMCQLA